MNKKNCGILSVFEEIKIEALAGAFSDFLQGEKERLSSDDIAKLEKEFLQNFENCLISDEQVKHFFSKNDLPKQMLSCWYKRIEIYVDPFIKSYLKWLGYQKKLEFLQQFARKEESILNFLENQPDFLKYLNSEIQDIKHTR